jgi:hypothetical protein
MSRHIDTGKTNVITNEVPESAVVVPSPDEDLDEFMRMARVRYDVMVTAWNQNRNDALDDDKMLAGDQWDEIIVKERTEEGRPILTYNLLLTFCNQIVNQVRQDWPQIKVKPVDANAGPTQMIANLQGNKDYSMAEVYMGIIRNIEHISRADHAYITALEHQVQHGFGFFRAQPVYTRDDSFEQEIRIWRIKNSYSVLVDASAQEADFSDMQDAFIHTMVRRDQFQRKWPDARAVSFESNEQGNSYEGWYDKELLRIAEYFYIAYKQDEVIQLNNGMVVYETDVKEVLDDMKRDEGIYVVNSRKVKRPVCRWQKMTAHDILEGPVDIPCSYIPIFPVLGKELMRHGETRYNSAIRDAKDAQRAFNYWQTAASETVALAPRAPFILTQKQVAGHETMWEQANRKNFPYLPYNAQENVPPPQRQYADAGAIAELQQAESQKMVMQDIIGMHEANVGAKSNERSGVAVRERAQRGELATYVFLDNLSRSMEHLGRCLIEMIPKVYDSQRILRLRLPDDSEDFVEINKAVLDEDTGKTVYVHDLTYGKYDVVISTAPNFATQREEAQTNILETMQRLPPDKASMVVHLLVKNMDYPGADEVYEVLRKMLPDDFKTPDERARDLPSGITLDDNNQPVDEQGQPWQKPLSAQEQIAMAEQNAETKKHEATIEKAKAETAKAAATLAEAQGEMAALQQGGEQGQDGAAMQQQGEQMTAQIMQEVQQLVTELVEAAMEQHEDRPGAHEAMGVDDKITEAMVDALRRVKKVYDAKLADLGPALTEAKVAQQSAGGDGGGSPVQVEVNVQGTRVESIEIERGEDGTLRAVPQYEAETGAD